MKMASDGIAHSNHTAKPDEWLQEDIDKSGEPPLWRFDSWRQAKEDANDSDVPLGMFDFRKNDDDDKKSSWVNYEGDFSVDLRFCRVTLSM
jgi:hypothetical protein